MGIDRYLGIDGIPQQLHLEGFPVIIRKVCVCQNETFLTVPHFVSQLQLLISSECNRAIFIITDMAIAIIFHARFYYICDSHSRDSNGLPTPDGLSILMKFCSISLVEIYIYHVYLFTRNQEHVWFQLQFIETQINELAINTSFQTHFSYQNNAPENYTRIFGPPEHARRKK